MQRAFFILYKILLMLLRLGRFELPVTWFIITKTIGIRVSKSEESLGMDKAELGMEAYPEFTN